MLPSPPRNGSSPRWCCRCTTARTPSSRARQRSSRPPSARPRSRCSTCSRATRRRSRTMPAAGPFAGVTRDIAFASAPRAAENAKVAVHLPATFDPKAPFLLCVFLHGLAGDVAFEDHIQRAIDQIGTSSANALLVAPRFGPGVRPGTFEDSAGFASFVAEVQAELTAGGIAAPSDAPIVLVAF